MKVLLKKTVKKKSVYRFEHKDILKGAHVWIKNRNNDKDVLELVVDQKGSGAEQMRNVFWYLLKTNEDGNYKYINEKNEFKKDDYYIDIKIDDSVKIKKIIDEKGNVVGGGIIKDEKGNEGERKNNGGKEKGDKKKVGGGSVSGVSNIGNDLDRGECCSCCGKCMRCC